MSTINISLRVKTHIPFNLLKIHFAFSSTVFEKVCKRSPFFLQQNQGSGIKLLSKSKSLYTKQDLSAGKVFLFIIINSKTLSSFMSQYKQFVKSYWTETNSHLFIQFKEHKSIQYSSSLSFSLMQLLDWCKIQGLPLWPYKSHKTYMHNWINDNATSVTNLSNKISANFKNFVPFQLNEGTVPDQTKYKKQPSQYDTPHGPNGSRMFHVIYDI